MMNDKPCKIIWTKKAKPGKHGSAKVIIKGMNLLDGKTVDQSFGTSDTVDCPIIKRKEFQLLRVTDDEFLHLLTDEGMKEDVRLPEEDGMYEDVRNKIEEFMNAEKPIYV